ncbi:NAD-binding protein [Favolaschia claudopus]|uniref:NAD-binding protein n=1 Tax=Favolaschia claudopus TaxID=2862362 RepID=A0AAV9ZTX1_9AGAR
MTSTNPALKDLTGKVIILTGGNSGIGYATTQLLARQGAKVYMATRSQSRAADAIARLKSEGLGTGTVEWLELDLADPRSARRAAEEFLGKEERLDVLVNNAALVSGPFKLNADGLLDIMVINHISHFVLTEALLPLMKQTAANSPDSDVRIVAVTSNALAFVQPESFATRETLNKQFGDSALGMVKTYGYTKLANILHMKALQRRLDSENPNNNITCIAVHPGTTKTPATEGFMGAKLPLIGGFIGTVIMPLIFAKPSKGGMAVAIPAAGVMQGKERAGDWKGAYFTPKGIETPSASALDVRLQDELWETTRSVAKELGLSS